MAGLRAMQNERLIFDGCEAGQSFLHAGCRDLSLCVKAAELGLTASACTLERDVLARRHGDAADRTGSLKVERRDLERQGLQGRFDTVYCGAYLREARNPVGVLETLIAATRRRLVLQLELRQAERISRDRSLIGGDVLRRLPAIYLAPWKRKHGVDQSFYMTETAAVALLKTLRQDFAKVEVFDAGGRRPLIVASKRRIRTLHIIAGVNAIGKSTLLDKLRSGEKSEVADEMAFDLSKPWYFTTYAHLLRETEVAFDCLVAQYNITAPLVHGALHGNHHGLQDLIESADTVDVTTMWLAPEEQRARYHQDRVPDTVFARDLYNRRKIAKRRDVHGRENIAPKESFLRGLFYVRSAYTRRKADRLLSIYGDRQTYLNMYDDWFDFLEHMPATARVLYQQPDYHTVSIDEWRRRELGSNAG